MGAAIGLSLLVTGWCLWKLGRWVRQELWAVVHAGTYGHSSYLCPYDRVVWKGEGFESLRDKYVRSLPESERSWGYDDITGAWILTYQQVQLLGDLWADVRPGNVQDLNAGVQRIATTISKLHLGRRPKEVQDAEAN